MKPGVNNGSLKTLVVAKVSFNFHGQDNVVVRFAGDGSLQSFISHNLES